MSRLNEICIGGTVKTQHRNGRAAEASAIAAYNEGIRPAMEVGDNRIRELMESILKNEENHIDWLEAQLDQIAQTGTQNYLVEQID